MPDSRKINLPIGGMPCASCVERNEKALRLVPGVISADVNFATEQATVEYDPGVVDVAALVAAVERVGYQVIVEKVDLAVQGMTCASCVERVERALAGMDGVVSASVNFAGSAPTASSAKPIVSRISVSKETRPLRSDLVNNSWKDLTSVTLFL